MVPEIMEVQAFQAGRLGGPAPDKCPPASVHRQALVACEHESIGLGTHICREVLVQYRPQFGRDHDNAVACRALGWPDNTLVADILGLLGDAESAVQ
jgi:hypothetical protein